VGIKQKTRTINGANYMVTQFPAFGPGGALEMAGRLTKLLAPVMGKAFSAIKGGKALDLDAAVLAPALEALAVTLDPKDFAELCFALFRCTTRNGQDLSTEVAFNEAFTGNFPEMFQAIHFVLEANDFFGLGGIGAMLGARAAVSAPPAS
jgi:hypothetical protein